MKDMTFVIVSGYIGSGSSAIVDYIKEFENTYECEAEIRTIRDPYGICQMEQALVDHWELINSSAAITDFLNLCNICSRKGGGKFPLARAGLRYSETVSKDFMKITQRYIDKLVDYEYCQDYYYGKFKKPYLKYAIDRCRFGAEVYSNGKIRLANRNIKCYFSKPTAEQFCAATQEYFQELYEPRVDDGGFIILDQAVSPNNTQVIHKYFKKAKMIVVDRDPRDMYIDEILHREMLDDDLSSCEAGIRYAVRQKALRSNAVDDADVLYVNFEDMIMNYEETGKRIMDFLGFTEKDHSSPKKHLKPEVSSKNVRMWQRHYAEYKDALDTLREELPELCYGE